jgi:hypothetical protein
MSTIIIPQLPQLADGVAALQTTGATHIAVGGPVSYTQVREADKEYKQRKLAIGT